MPTTNRKFFEKVDKKFSNAFHGMKMEIVRNKPETIPHKSNDAKENFININIRCHSADFLVTLKVFVAKNDQQNEPNF